LWKTALLTGASSGIGRATALELGRAGVRLALLGRRLEQLESVAAEIVASGGPLPVCLSVDLQDPEAVAQAVHRAYGVLSSLDLVCAIGALGTPNLAEDPKSEALIGPMFLTNTVGTIRLLEVAKTYMLAQGHGHLLAVSAAVDRRGMPGCALYAASKAALANYMEGLGMAFELQGLPIVTTTVYPGYVDTPMSANVPNRWLLQSPEVAAKRLLAGASRRKRVVAFPWPIAWAGAILVRLPRALYLAIIRTDYEAMRRTLND